MSGESRVDFLFLGGGRARGDFFAKKSRKKLLTPGGLGRLGALCGGEGVGGRAMPAEGRKKTLSWPRRGLSFPRVAGGAGVVALCPGDEVFLVLFVHKKNGPGLALLGLGLGGVVPGLPRRQGAPRNDGVGRGGGHDGK